MKYRRLESETLRLFRAQKLREVTRTKNVVERSILRTEVAGEALKNTNERVMLRNLKERDRVIRDLASRIARAL